jgi:hypothetical protein
MWIKNANGLYVPDGLHRTGPATDQEREATQLAKETTVRKVPGVYRMVNRFVLRSMEHRSDTI